MEQARWLRMATAVCDKCDHLVEELEKSLHSPVLKGGTFSADVAVCRRKVMNKRRDLQKDAPIDFFSK